MRKAANYEIDNRIQVGYRGMDYVFDKFVELIKKEVLANNIQPDLFLENDVEKEFLIEDEKILITIKK
jgi:hypothetical protein